VTSTNAAASHASEAIAAGAERRWAIIGCGVLVALIVGVSAFFYPIWSAWIVPYDFWHSHMWLQTWV